MKLAIQKSLVLVVIGFAVLLNVNLAKGAAITNYPFPPEILNEPPADFPAHKLITLDEHSTFPQLKADYGLNFPDPDINLRDSGIPQVDSWIIHRDADTQPLTIKFDNPTKVFGMTILDMGDYAPYTAGVFILKFSDQSQGFTRFEDPQPNQLETGIDHYQRFLGISSDIAIEELTFVLDPSIGTDGFFIYDLRIDSSVAIVDLDIKPGSELNPVNLKSKGKLPVVVYGSDTLDVSMIDQASLLLNGVALSEKNNGSLFASLEDEDGDGILDLVMHFILQDLGIEAGTEELLVTGRFLDGSAFEGSDAISIVGSVDANLDGVVSAGDYSSVQANFGNVASAQVTPEPATLSFLMLGGIAMLKKRRR